MKKKSIKDYIQDINKLYKVFIYFLNKNFI